MKEAEYRIEDNRRMIGKVLCLIVLFGLVGCGVSDIYRPAQTVRFRAPGWGAEAVSVTYEYKERQEGLELKKSEGIYEIELPAIRRAGVMLLLVPLSDDSSDEEILHFQSEGIDIQRLTVRDFLESTHSDFEILEPNAILETDEPTEK